MLIKNILINLFIIFPIILGLNYLLWVVTGTFELIPFMKILFIVFLYLAMKPILAYLKII